MRRNPVPDGVYEITLGLYDAEVGGNQLCFDTKLANRHRQPVHHPLFQLRRRRHQRPGLWLQFQVGGDPR